MKKRVWSAFILACGLMITACSKPVPQEKSAYVGDWQAQNMWLRVTQDGRVEYKRIDGHTTTTVDAPLKSFDGDNFRVGVGPVETTFIVSVAPHQVDGEWKMTVDGVELNKAQ